MRLLTVVSIVAATVPWISSPAAAAPTCPAPASYAASAKADLLKVSLLNLRPLGLSVPEVAGLTMASTSATLATDGAVRSSAAADYLSPQVLGLRLPRGPLDARVIQQAPPVNQRPAQNRALAVDLGVAKAGTGELLAHAEWADGMACGAQLGRAGVATAALVDASVLPGSRGALVRLSENVSSRAGTALLARDDRPAASAVAQAGLSKVELLGSGNVAVTVRVIEPPQLIVTATGRKQTSTVTYTSPILEVSAPGMQTQRLEGLGRTIDVPFTTGGLGSILNGLSLASTSTLLRISIGDLTKTVTDREVSASAASLRLQLLTNASASVVDLSVGVLAASASAPPIAANPSPSGPPGDCGTPGCKLPLTGLNVGIAAGTGILLFVLGRFLLVITRRNSGRPAV